MEINMLLLVAIAVFLIAQGCFLYVIRMKLLVDIKHEVRCSVEDVWHELMASAIEELTRPDTIAEALSHMSSDQLAALADRVAELRGARGE